jgi:hypothetical protein
MVATLRHARENIIGCYKLYGDLIKFLVGLERRVRTPSLAWMSTFSCNFSMSISVSGALPGFVDARSCSGAPGPGEDGMEGDRRVTKVGDARSLKLRWYKSVDGGGRQPSEVVVDASGKVALMSCSYVPLHGSPEESFRDGQCDYR